MLSRKQLHLIQIVRGLSVAEIIQRTGIPAQSLMAFIGGSDAEGKDPSKLMSQTTYERVLALLGINQRFSGFRQNAVIEWRYSKAGAKGSPSWTDAMKRLRKELFSGDVELVEVKKKKSGIFPKDECMLFLRDNQEGIHLVITRADKQVRKLVQDTFGVEVIKSQTLTAQDFAITSELVSNSVYRVTQFNIIVGGKAVKYTWDEVMAAAKEFNFTTDDLIQLIVEKVHAAETTDTTPANQTNVTEFELRRVVAG